MGLIEFLRQWQGGRLAAGVGLSVLVHALVVAALLWGPPPFPRAAVKRGEPLIVELPPAADSPPPGRPGAPAPVTPTRPSPPVPKAPTPPVPKAPTSPAPRAPAAPPRPTVAARPAPPAPPSRPVERPLEQHVASVPAPKAPEAEAPSVPAPAAPEPAPAAPAPAPPPAAGAPPETVPPAEPTPQAQTQVAAVPPGAGQRPIPDIRSLKRGTGGAGGSGQGRGGIEGEPIPLDSEDPRYSDYLDQIRRRIKDKWGYPCVKNDSTRECEYKTAQLIIEFGIAKNGKVPFINIVRSSGYPIYDDYAVNAVKLADFPPIPDTFSKTGVPILATFSYVVQSSLTNILR
jgi:TonB family protein